MPVFDFKDAYHFTDYMVAHIVSGPPGELPLDACQVGDSIPCNGTNNLPPATTHDAPTPPLGRNCTENTWVLFGVEVAFLSQDTNDNALVANQVVLSVGPAHQRPADFIHPLAHLVASTETALASRIRCIEDTLREYLAAVGDNPHALPTTASAARTALGRLGAPLLFDHRRLQIPMACRPGEWLNIKLAWQQPLTVSAPVRLRFGFEWLRKRTVR